MRNLSTEDVSVFTYEEWLSRTRGPKRTMICEMPAVVDEEVMVELTTYIVQVKTSDVSGKLSTVWDKRKFKKNKNSKYMCNFNTSIWYWIIIW